ncbi:MAG: phospho-N-acetylmuramoyl-pentapeptide-transferase, partial [Planctomycetes bacterium]|nr:phospho-N-acetylmuramoyl-pentapeptide-transferase [Planctomycetota bacterium]
MFVWFLKNYGSLIAGASTGDSTVFLTARMALAAFVSFVTALVFGPLAIRWLKSRFRERIDSASSRLNELHASKKNTPTMGGLFISFAILVAALCCADLSNRYVIQSILIVIGFTGLGAMDDWIKINTAKRGLTVRQKFLAQLMFATAISAWLYSVQSSQTQGHELVSPIGRLSLSLGPVFIAWSAFVIVGSSNGVNLTDGLDGLAGGCLIFSSVAFAALTYLSGHRVMSEYLSIPHIIGAGELGVLFAAMVGAMMGFLWFNCHPAEVFMGDTGSLPAGALLGYGALVTRQEFLL